MNETFEERASRWEIAINKILIEVLKEKNVNDLYFTIDTSGVIRSFSDLLNRIREAKQLG